MKFKCLHSLLTLVIIFSLVCITGCGGDSPTEPDKPNPEAPNPDQPQEALPVPGLSFTSVTLPNDGDTFACVIHGLTGNSWSAESDQPWCNVSTHDNVLKISVDPNNEIDMRCAKISILHSDGRKMGKILINQCAINVDETIEVSSSTKHSFYPMFTATWCPFSPDMDRTLEEIQKRWSYPIIPMRIHVKDSELYSPLSVELSDLYGNSSTPTGYFENYFSVSNRHDGNVSVDYFWNLILSRTSDGNGYVETCSSIGCKSSMSDKEINAEITIEPITTGQYRLLVFVLEDNIIKPQMSQNEGEIKNYCHNGVLVGSLTSTKGQELELTSSLKTLTIKGDVPKNANLSNLRLLIVLERNIAHLNYSDECWYADNCLSVSLGKSTGSGQIENMYIGNEIDN